MKTELVIPERKPEQEKKSWKEIVKGIFRRKKIDPNSKKKKRRGSSIEATEDMDVEDLDWWTKYYASLEVIIYLTNVEKIANLLS